MSASMLDEVEIPVKKQPMYICPCCKFTFTDVHRFKDHCNTMKDTIDLALRAVGGNK